MSNYIAVVICQTLLLIVKVDKFTYNYFYLKYFTIVIFLLKILFYGLFFDIIFA